MSEQDAIFFTLLFHLLLLLPLRLSEQGSFANIERYLLLIGLAVWVVLSRFGQASREINASNLTIFIGELLWYHRAYGPN